MGSMGSNKLNPFVKRFKSIASNWNWLHHLLLLFTLWILLHLTDKAHLNSVNLHINPPKLQLTQIMGTINLQIKSLFLKIFLV